MKRAILSILITLCVLSASATNTLNTSNITLTPSGSVTLLSSSAAQLYYATGADSLTGDLSIIFSGTPLKGSQFTIWFNNTNINTTHGKVFILSQDYTNIVKGSVNVFVTCTYGTSWTVSSVNATVLSYLGSFVTTDELSDALSNYGDTTSLNTKLTAYALLSSATFSSIRVPTQSQSDSSTFAASTAFARALAKASVAGLATTTYVNTAIAASVSTATTSITSAYTIAISTAIQTFQVNPTIVDTGWIAGTYDLHFLATGVSNTLQPSTIRGNIVLSCSSPPSGVSEVTIILPFAGSYTVTAGTGVSLPDTITGASTHVSVLTLVWSTASNAYVRKCFSQN